MTDEEMLQIEAYVKVTTVAIAQSQSLRQYHNGMGELAVEDEISCPGRKSLYNYAFIVGYSRAIFDIKTGRLNINTIEIDLGKESHENEKLDIEQIRRSKAAGDGQVDNMAGEE